MLGCTAALSVTICHPPSIYTPPCPHPQARLEATEQQLQAQAEAAQLSAQQSQASPAAFVAGASRSSQQEQAARSASGRSRSALPSEELDPEERALLQRRLSAKQREAEAAAAALAAAQAATAQREGELEAERARAAALADEVARWKDECAQVGAGLAVLADTMYMPGADGCSGMRLPLPVPASPAATHTPSTPPHPGACSARRRHARWRSA